MSKLVAIGLPETGKTTFLAALWHVTESEDVQGSLRLERISEEAKHLNNIRNEWLSFQRVTRTIPGQEQPVSLLLRNEQGAVGQVAFPDLSGEEFEKAWTERNWPRIYDEHITTARGFLLFIHPGTVKEPTSIADMQKLAEAAFPDDAEPDANSAIVRDSEKTVEAQKEWDPENAPTQVQLVDVLQFIYQRSKAQLPIRLAIIVSAWDVVKNRVGNEYVGETGAEDWLKARLPYLDQFLRANPEFLTVRIYAVSAQGGDLKADREELLRFKRTADRIFIEGRDCAPHDISEPIRWCLGLR